MFGKLSESLSRSGHIPQDFPSMRVAAFFAFASSGFDTEGGKDVRCFKKRASGIEVIFFFFFKSF